ncbi:unnamed protein product, partial [Meganyctiphanes norvegica]
MYIYLVQSPILLFVLMAKEFPSTQADSSHSTNDHSFIPAPPGPEAILGATFIPPSPSLEPILTINIFIPPPPSLEPILTNNFVPPPPSLEPILTNNFVPPPPSLEPILTNNFIPPPPDLTNLPKTILSEIEKISQNENLIPRGPITRDKIHQNIQITRLRDSIGEQQKQQQQQQQQQQQHQLQGFNKENTFLQADYSFGTSEYYFTWLHNDKKYTYSEAHSFCHNLPGDWYVISIESIQENQLITNLIEHC